MSDQTFSIPEQRLRSVNAADVRADREFVLYWMTSYRRLSWNFALQHAAHRARELDRPLVILEALRSDYPWASDRLHAFVLQGMADHVAATEGNSAVHYYPYVERAQGESRGLLAALADRACTVVTDDWPGFFVPRMLARAAEKLPVRLEAVDSAGLFPFRATERVFKRAVDFRRFLQTELPRHLGVVPLEDPLARLPSRPIDLSDLRQRWPSATLDLLSTRPEALARLPIDHSVPVARLVGGPVAAKRRLSKFVSARLQRYASQRDRLDETATSGLSPYLHFGHISAHQLFNAVSRVQNWSLEKLGDSRRGTRVGWWGMDEHAEAFLDQLVTWRELGLNAAAWLAEYDRYDSLPQWAIRTLAEHSTDPRQHVYELEQLELASTHDPVWNAGQNELRTTGVLHNRMRMLWGKKILEWTASPQEALVVMESLNNKYALDGRDPNSYSGIFWVLGRYDRAWGPQRPIFGKIRYMSSDAMQRKPGARKYLERWTISKQAEKPRKGLV